VSPSNVVEPMIAHSSATDPGPTSSSVSPASGAHTSNRSSRRTSGAIAANSAK
jgi:hypothetical protein